MKFSLGNNRFGIMTHMHGMSDHKKHYEALRTKLSRTATREMLKECLSKFKLKIPTLKLNEELLSANYFAAACSASSAEYITAMQFDIPALATRLELSDALKLTTGIESIVNDTQPMLHTLFSAEPRLMRGEERKTEIADNNESPKPV
ncbi:MAG: hypothetical protein NTZ67_00790 [Gammaproteobacteria bacterium]|nr:hypothetical protein [Gammaproteobacteria bacterium]